MKDDRHYLRELTIILKEDSQIDAFMQDRVNRMNVLNFIPGEEVRDLIDQTKIKTKRYEAKLKLFSMFRPGGDIDLFNKACVTRNRMEITNEI